MCVGVHVRVAKKQRRRTVDNLTIFGEVVRAWVKNAVYHPLQGILQVGQSSVVGMGQYHTATV